VDLKRYITSKPRNVRSSCPRHSRGLIRVVSLFLVRCRPGRANLAFRRIGFSFRPYVERYLNFLPQNGNSGALSRVKLHGSRARFSAAFGDEPGRKFSTTHLKGSFMITKNISKGLLLGASLFPGHGSFRQAKRASVRSTKRNAHGKTLAPGSTTFRMAWHRCTQVQIEHSSGQGNHHHRSGPSSPPTKAELRPLPATPPKRNRRHQVAHWRLVAGKE